MLIEVWGIDDAGRDTLGGYGVAAIPMHEGKYLFKVHCWRPKKASYSSMISSFEEFEIKDVVLSSAARFDLNTESTGIIEVNISIITKDFKLHGVNL